MITRLEIENFKAIRKVAVDLTPLTVFVGPNDSGKSTILQALALLGRCASGATPLDRAGGVFEREPIEYFPDQRNVPMRIAAEGTSAGKPFRYEVTFGWQSNAFGLLREKIDFAGRTTLDDNMLGKAMSALAAFADPVAQYGISRRDLGSILVRFDAQKMAEPSTADAALTSEGRGLPGLINRLLTSPDRAPLEHVERHLRNMSKHVRGVATKPLPGGAKKELWFANGGKGFSAQEASGGLVLTAGYLALLYGTDSQRFLVEEPENGVHPHAILMIVDVLRDIAQAGKQVLLTTHSPVLLSYMKPADVRVVTRSKDGVIVTPMFDSPYYSEMSEKMDLGELWYSVHEENAVSTAS